MAYAIAGASLISEESVQSRPYGPLDALSFFAERRMNKCGASKAKADAQWLFLAAIMVIKAHKMWYNEG
ncbi:hypothetical protein A7975_02805 [Bacillus sp. FJAT-26390]|nr:hypothetical protein A7975_02805 [Bacillus sp. FJAT-26390]